MKTTSLSAVKSAKRVNSSHSRTLLLDMVSNLNFFMQPMPFNFSIWLYEIHSSSSVSATASLSSRSSIQAYLKPKLFEIEITSPEMDLMLLRPSERIRSRFKLLIFASRSMQFEDSDSFLRIIIFILIQLEGFGHFESAFR